MSAASLLARASWVPQNFAMFAKFIGFCSKSSKNLKGRSFVGAPLFYINRACTGSPMPRCKIKSLKNIWPWGVTRNYQNLSSFTQRIKATPVQDVALGIGKTTEIWFQRCIWCLLRSCTPQNRRQRFKRNHKAEKEGAHLLDSLDD